MTQFVICLFSFSLRTQNILLTNYEVSYKFVLWFEMAGGRNLSTEIGE